MKISVITPTFNRAYILTACYNSLCAQTSKDFEWIVIDDGSVDDTESLVRGFIEESKIVIKYIRQTNGGKHRAHNVGVDNSEGDLVVCLDSDDQLAPNAIEVALRQWKNIKTNNNLIGILALRGDLDLHRPICSRIPKDVKVATMTELRDKYGFQGDTVLFFKTDTMKNHKFQEFEGEKFLTEVNLYCELDCLGEMFLIDEVLYYGEYRKDGLTAQYSKLLAMNPQGTADTYYRLALNAISLKLAFKYAIIANAYRNLIPTYKRLKFERKRFLMVTASIFAPLFYLRYIKKSIK
ncbi:MAG: glycosyltransferase family 2 protein [Muribaculaceae bacterium]|nr:glycosyltransferase family 2 protein [Muribaculaceae bacterium]